MSQYSTPQEQFWAGEFGTEYIRRNTGDDVVLSNEVLFRNILRRATGIRNVLEMGCNIGLNLDALHRIDPCLTLSGYEINEKAVAIARGKGIAHIVPETIIGKIAGEASFDLTFTKTVLIHINPEFLAQVYENLWRLSRRYVMVCEYYNPTPVTVNYRGHTDRLFKRDFAGELIERFGLKLVDYGFAYHREPAMRYQDDVTWFLLEK
jgi:pseudaminic acid biosynthesis-associated methylase